MLTFHTVARPLIAVALLAGVPLVPMATLAQSNPPPVVMVDAHTQLFEAIYSGVDQEQVLDTLIRQISDQIVNSQPEAALMEAQRPGLLLELMLALRPTLRDYRNRIRQEFDPQIIAVSREVFTADEALQLAEFYNSDMGRMMMGLYTSNFSSDESIDQALDKQDISAEALAADDAMSVNRSVGALLATATPEQLESLATLPQRLPALLRMPELQERTMPIRTAMENAPPTAAEQQAIQLAIEEAFTKYLEREGN